MINEIPINECDKNTMNTGPQKVIKYIDLFCGMGGFHLGIDNACKNQKKQATCVFASDIDKYVKKTYKAN